MIAHVCNDRGGWGRGFVRAISARWGEPERAYRALARGGLTGGTTQLVRVEDGVRVANMVAQEGYASAQRTQALNETWLRSCLIDLRRQVGTEEAIVMPRIGTGLGGGDWERISALVAAELVAFGYRVAVYSLA